MHAYMRLWTFSWFVSLQDYKCSFYVHMASFTIHRDQFGAGELISDYIHSFLCCVFMHHYSDIIISAMTSQITSLTIIYHYTDGIMGTMASQINSLKIVYSAVYSDADQRKHQISASLAFVRGIHRWPVNSSHKVPLTRKTSSCEVRKWTSN